MKKNKILYPLLLLTLLHFSNKLSAQVGIKQDGSAIDSTAQLELQSTEQGFLLPRMTQAQRLAIPSPTDGLFLFQTDSGSGFQYNTDVAGDWERVVGVAEISILDPRTCINDLDTDGDGSVTIDEPGSYYLNDTLVLTGFNDAITIDSDNVTIDLNGFAIIAGPQSTDDGIYIRGLQNNITIKNGVISGFGGSGIRGGATNQSTFEHLILKDNGGDGIIVDDNCLIKYCTASNNGYDGIDAGGDNSIIRDCTASFNGFDGIDGEQGTTVYNCTSFNNGADGIDVLYGSKVEACTVYGNEGSGIDLALGGICLNNTAYRNGIHGLDISSNCLVMNNISNENGVCISNSTCASGGGLGSNTSQGAGIKTFANSFIINNQCHGNYFGIVNASTDATVIGNDVQNNRHAGIMGSSSGCLFIKNSAHNNGFEQAPGVSDTSTYPMGNIVFRSDATAYGPIIDVTNAGDLSTISNSDHPFANFVY